MTTSLFIRTGTRYRAATAPEVCERATSYVLEQANRKCPLINNPNDAKNMLLNLSGLDHEEFGVIYLNSRHRVICIERSFTGTIDGAAVHPREIVKRALQHTASSVMFFHNHPSGSPDASGADEVITRRLKEALALIDVRVLDHLIIAGTTLISMAERGLI